MADFWVEEALDRAVLPMERLDLAPAPMQGVGAGFCRQLCALHRQAAPGGDGRFGWWRDNWLGITPQRIRWSDGGTSRAGWPPSRCRRPAPGLPRRGRLYQLNHLLSHALLFGSGYARQAMTLADALLTEH